MDYRSAILTVARTYCAKTGKSMARVATLAHNGGAFFKNIEAGKGFTIDTYAKVMQWFSDNWPADLEWPVGIDRPFRPVSAAGLCADTPPEEESQEALRPTGT